MFSQNWFEAVVEVVMEKPVSLAQLIPLNLVSKNVLLFFDWHIIFPKDFTLGTTLPKSCLVQMKFQELGSAHACLDFLRFCKRVEMRLLDFPSVLNWMH